MKSTRDVSEKGRFYFLLNDFLSISQVPISRLEAQVNRAMPKGQLGPSNIVLTYVLTATSLHAFLSDSLSTNNGVSNYDDDNEISQSVIKPSSAMHCLHSNRPQSRPHVAHAPPRVMALVRP